MTNETEPSPARREFSSQWADRKNTINIILDGSTVEKTKQDSELFSGELRTKCPKGTRHRKIGGRWKEQELGEPVGQGRARRPQ